MLWSAPEFGRACFGGFDISVQQYCSVFVSALGGLNLSLLD